MNDERDAGRDARVVSLGSVNVDRLHRVTGADLEELAARHDWFPERGETVRVESLPEAFAVDTDGVRHGGKGANQAVAAARAGAATALLGAVGEDHDRFGIFPRLRAAGVDATRVATVSAPTGTADVFVDPDGENRIVVHPGANGAVDPAYVERHADAVRAADWLLLQNEIPVDPVAALLRDLADDPARPTVLLDPAPAAGVEPLLATGAVDYLTPNECEYETLGTALEGIGGVVVQKRGADDVVVTEGGERRFAVTPPSVDPVDTTGAGDAFNGFLAAELAAGRSLREAVETAAVAGALAVCDPGAREAIPTLADVRSFRATSGGT